MPVCGSPVLPPVAFNYCAPDIRPGQITKILITRDTSADVMTSASDLAEWNTRINASSVIPGSGAAPIRELTVVASLAAPDVTEQDISGGRKYRGKPEHKIAYKIDELSLGNINDLMHDYQVAGAATVKMWFVSGGLLFGGNTGISASVSSHLVIPEDINAVSTIEGEFSFKDYFPDGVIVSPFG